MDPEAEPKPPAADSSAYEEHWYRQLKAWAERDEPVDEAVEPESLEPEALSATDDMSTIAAIEALEAIAEIGGYGAVDALIGCLTDPEPRVRIRALQLLGETGDARAANAMRSVGANDAVPQVVTAARMALAKLGAPI